MTETIDLSTLNNNSKGNMERFKEGNTDIFVSRRNQKRFSTIDDVLSNFTEFNKNLTDYLKNIGLDLPQLYDSDENHDIEFHNYSKNGCENYKSFTDYLQNKLSSSDLEKITNNISNNYKNGYESFLYNCFPFIMISFHRQQYFNVLVNKNGKYVTPKGSGERLVLLLENMSSKWSLTNQEERNNQTTYTGIKLRDIMPSLVFDINQSTERGQLSMLALLYIEDIYKLSFLLFKDEIIKKYKEGNKIPLKKKIEMVHLNNCDKVLFKQREYMKTNPDTDEKEAVEIIYYELKLLGKPDNYLQTLITNYTEDDNNDVMKINNSDVNLDNIKEAIPKNSLCTCFINLESICLVGGKQLYMTNKAYQMDVNRKHSMENTGGNKTFDFRQHIKTMKNVEYHKINDEDDVEKEDKNNLINNDEDNNEDNISNNSNDI
tara:strand:- start:435 stop:1730 length:1296 start_codon:yes stop_codon:yes gene_type:complete